MRPCAMAGESPTRAWRYHLGLFYHRIVVARLGERPTSSARQEPRRRGLGGVDYREGALRNGWLGDWPRRHAIETSYATPLMRLEPDAVAGRRCLVVRRALAHAAFARRCRSSTFSAAWTSRAAPGALDAGAPNDCGKIGSRRRARHDAAMTPPKMKRPPPASADGGLAHADVLAIGKGPNG